MSSGAGSWRDARSRKGQRPFESSSSRDLREPCAPRSGKQFAAARQPSEKVAQGDAAVEGLSDLAEGGAQHAMKPNSLLTGKFRRKSRDRAGFFAGSRIVSATCRLFPVGRNRESRVG